MISSKLAVPAASIIGSAALTPMIGTWPRRNSATAASFSALRFAARRFSSAPPKV
jgi:hypothetical protein